MFHVEHSGESAALKRLTFEHLFSPRTAWLTHRHDRSPYIFTLKQSFQQFAAKATPRMFKEICLKHLLILKATLIKP